MCASPAALCTPRLPTSQGFPIRGLMAYATPPPPIWWRAERTCEAYRRSWATPRSPRPRSTPTSRPNGCSEVTCAHTRAPEPGPEPGPDAGPDPGPELKPIANGSPIAVRDYVA